MEKLEIISKALHYGKCASHIELDKIIKELNSFALNDFFEKNSPKIDSFDSEIRNIVEASFWETKPDDEKIKNISNIICSAKKILENGIDSTDLKSILVFISINCYLDLKINNLVSIDKINKSPISENILKLISNLNLEIGPRADAPYSEKEMFDNFNLGFKESNIFKTYNLIESIERGRGFHFNYLYENLIKFLFDFDFDAFIERLSSLEKLTEIIFHLQILKQDELLKVIESDIITNKWSNFELIRQIVRKENQNQSTDEEKVLKLGKALKRIKKADFEFLMQLIKYFDRSKLINASLGIFLTKINKNSLERIISECFVIDKYDNNIEAKTFLRDYFLRNADNKKIEIFISLIFDKWKNFMESLHHDNQFYLNNILITSYANFVIDYFTHFEDNETLIKKIESLLNKIIFIDSEWFQSQSNQITKVHLYLSEIFLLFHSLKNEITKDSIIRYSHEKIINNKLLNARYISSGTKRFFDENILKL